MTKGAVITAWLAVALVPMGSSSQWTVPVTVEPLQIDVQGTVEISRASVQTIRTGSPGAVVSWIGPDGKHAAFGDELMRLDTTALQQRHQDLRNELTVLSQRGSNQLFALETALAQQEEDLAVMLEDLQVKKAEAQAAAKPDPSRIATLQREIDLIRQEAVLQETELRRKKNLYELGELARVEVEDAELAVEATRRSIRIAQLTLEEAEDGSDPVLARRAAWQVERARISIGADADGGLHGHRGYGRKLAATRRNLARRRSSVLTNVEAHQVEVQSVARAAWAHLPLQELRILDGQEVLHTFKGTHEAATALYDATRGFGWVEAPATAPSTNALVIRGTAQWRCDLLPGDYRIEVVLGDTVEWNCMSIRQADRPLVAVNRLLPDQMETYTADVKVGEDGLHLDVGLTHKAILASAAGTVKNQTWLRLGGQVRDNPPALFLTPSAHLVVRSRVHHLQVPFFEPSPAATMRVELCDSSGRWVPGGPVIITDDPMPFFPGEDENHLEGGERRPEERTAREITVAVPPEYKDGFAFAAHVTCRAVVEPAVGTIAVPCFLIHEGEDGLWARRNGEPVQVKGRRYDQYFILESGISPDDRLSPPEAPKTEGGRVRFTGEVVSGSAVPMVVPIRSWARIKSLVPHGSWVDEGDLVMTLYRPEENEKAAKAEAKAVAAETNFLEAADQQQAAFLRATAAHAQAVQVEKLAADRVAEDRRLDQAVLAGADETERAAAEELAVLERRVSMLAGKESTRLAYEDYRRRRDVLRLQAQRHALDTVAAFRQGSYTQQLQNRLRWRQARKELAVREAKVALNLDQEEVLSQRALSTLEQNLEDREIGRDFESRRFLHAPASGNVFYQRGYNDLAKRTERIDEEFVVWNGLTVAEILDMSNLSFRIRLPESHYHRVHSGMALSIELEDLGDRMLMGKITTKGRSLYVPRKQGRRDKEAIRLNRVFDVTLSFAVPEDLHDQVRPGLRGSVALP